MTQSAIINVIDAKNDARGGGSVRPRALHLTF
jgi:hypothetical protein